MGVDEGFEGGFAAVAVALIEERRVCVSLGAIGGGRRRSDASGLRRRGLANGVAD